MSIEGELVDLGDSPISESVTSCPDCKGELALYEYGSEIHGKWVETAVELKCLRCRKVFKVK